SPRFARDDAVASASGRSESDGPRRRDWSSSAPSAWQRGVALHLVDGGGPHVDDDPLWHRCRSLVTICRHAVTSSPSRAGPGGWVGGNSRLPATIGAASSSGWAAPPLLIHQRPFSEGGDQDEEHDYPQNAGHGSRPNGCLACWCSLSGHRGGWRRDLRRKLR